ncbi:MAG: tyrosine-type recombinase/integrase [Terriglobia bacterium]|jgi:integrase
MSRKRHQQGNLKVVRGRWIAPWWKGGHRRNKALGKAGKITKSQAQDKLAEILAPIYTQQQGPNRRLEIRRFEEWVFPSETRKTPLATDTCWRRWIAPRLKPVGLEWVNFQVMRRTHASLMRELKVDPKTVADQLGHSVDVDLNVYTTTALGPRKEALNAFESALRVM